MQELLFHPKVVHIPMALAVLMPLIAGGVVFAYLRGWLDHRTWMIVFLLQGVLLGSGLIAMNTGEREEERVEQVVAERHIDAHEDSADLFVWSSAILLALMAVPLLLREGEFRNAMVIFCALGTVVVFVLGYRTGEAGGRLVYEHGAANAYVGAAEDSALKQFEALEEYEYDVDSDE
jgi:uncharacterized membrane protein